MDSQQEQYPNDSRSHPVSRGNTISQNEKNIVIMDYQGPIDGGNSNEKEDGKWDEDQEAEGLLK